MTRRRRPSRFLAPPWGSPWRSASPRLRATPRPRPAAWEPASSRRPGCERSRTARSGCRCARRSVMGAFGETGSYATSATGNREVGFEEDLFGALRLGSHLQVGLWAPFVQTGRQLGRPVGLGRWTRRRRGQRSLRRHQCGHAWRLAGDRAAGGAVGPDRPGPRRSGRPARDVGHRNRIVRRERRGRDSKRSPARRSCRSGAGSRNAARAPCMGREQSFAPRLSALLAGGYTFGHERHRRRVRVTACGRATRRDAGVAMANSGVALVTAGAALALPFWNLAAADDDVQRRPDRRLGAQSVGRVRRHPGDHPLLDLPTRSAATDTDHDVPAQVARLLLAQRRAVVLDLLQLERGDLVLWPSGALG